MHKREDLERAHLRMLEQKSEFEVSSNLMRDGYYLETLDPLNEEYWEDDVLFFSIGMPKLEEETEFLYKDMMKAIETHKV